MTAEAISPQVAGGAEALGWLRAVATVAFIATLPLLLIATSLAGLVGDRAFILSGFEDNGVGQTTGLSPSDLTRVADAFVTYFQSPPGDLQLQVTVNGQVRPLFNDAEVSHMRDVQALIQFFFRLQILAAVVAVVRLLIAVFVERSVVSIGRDMLLGASLVFVLVLVVVGLSFVDFDNLWIVFHRLAFRNNNWMFDPRTDYLIMLFPEPFWFTATVRMALTLIAQTLAVALTGFLLWRFAPVRAFGRSS